MVDLVGKHGIELEGYVQAPNKINLTNHGLEHQRGLKFLQRISERFYFDDNKPEFPTLPYTNLGELSLHTKDIISKGHELLKKEGYNYIFIGCLPFQTSFASGHIHSSISKNPSRLEQRKMRRRLYSVQPFIALLGMNSPIYNGIVADILDVRLGYGHWSEFTIYNSNDSSHYLSLANGRKTTTLETRIPSSSTLHQIMGCVAFVKTILNLRKSPPIISNAEKLFYSVVQYGGQALVPISNPLTLNFLGLGEEEIYIPINELFKLFISRGETKDVLNEVMMEFNSVERKKIYEFFNLISNGYTMSDFTMVLFNALSSDRTKLSNELSKITYSSYAKDLAIWDFIDKPEHPIPPILEERITLEELDQLISEWKNKSSDLDELNKFKEFEHILLTDPRCILRNKKTRELFDYFLSNRYGSIEALKAKFTINKSYFDLFIKYKIIKFSKKKIPLPFASTSEGDSLTRGKNFSIVAQLVKECDRIKY